MIFGRVSSSSSPIKPPITTYAPKAQSKSATALLARSFALAGELSIADAGARSCGSTERSRPSASQPCSGRTASPTRRMRIGTRSVPKVDRDDPSRELGGDVLLPAAIVAAARAAEEHRLGLEAAVARPRVQLATGERHTGVARPECRRPAVRKRVCRRQLAQLGEARVDDREVDEVAAGGDGGDAPRVELGREEVFAAAAGHGAAGKGPEVDLVMSRLEVDQRVQAQAAGQ